MHRCFEGFIESAAVISNVHTLLCGKFDGALLLLKKYIRRFLDDIIERVAVTQKVRASICCGFDRARSRR